MQLKALMAQQRALYDRKNADDDNAFHLLVERFGLVAALIHVTDKMERIKCLRRNSDQTADESLKDAVSDALNDLLMLSAEMICGTWLLVDESRIEGEAENITVVHRLMDSLAADELLMEEQTDAEQMLSLWDELCDAVMQSLDERTPEKVDDLLTVNNYLAALAARYLLQLTA